MEIPEMPEIPKIPIDYINKLTKKHQKSKYKITIPYIAHDGAEVYTLEELKRRNDFFSVMDGAEVQGNINDMIGNVDIQKLRDIQIPPGLESAIEFYRDNAAAVTVYSGSIRGFVASRTMRKNVYVRGLDTEGHLLQDGQNFISFWVDDLDIPIEKDGTEMHPKVRKQVVALTLASKIADAIGKPFRRFYDSGPWDYQTMSPANLVDFSLPESEVVGQIRNALYVTDGM